MTNELIQIERRLRNIEEILKREDFINEDDAARWLGIVPKTMKNKRYSGSLNGKFVISVTGQVMYFKSKLVYQ